MNIEALIIHPSVGSIWLSNCEIKNGCIVGDVWNDSGRNSNLLPEDYRGEYMTMNFPISCIKKMMGGKIK